MYTGAATGFAARTYFQPDERGSIVALVNADGTNQVVKTYDEYGISTNPATGRFGYTGQAWIDELGLYYYKARMYSPTLGRFLQVDPIGYEDQFNLYAYVGADPVNLSDPTGMEVQFAGKKEDLEALLEQYANGCSECAAAVQSLQDSNKTHIIADASVLSDEGRANLEASGGGMSVAYPRTATNDAAAHDGTGTGSLIVIDIDNPPTYNGEEYSQASRLGHEIDHSVDYDRGTLSKGQLKRENSAIDAANKYRKAVGEKLRPREQAERRR